MCPLHGFKSRANAAFVVGEVYHLDLIEERSAKSHRHYFAAINEAWSSLPEHLAQQWPTPEHLRKHALIATGYRDETSFVASSKAEALRIAAFMRPADDFSVISVNGALVVRATAKSQSLRAMGKDDFTASKTAVLDWIADLLGTPRETIEARGSEAA